MKQRQLILTEKDDAYFTWVKLKYTQVTHNSTIGKALAYSIHQESHLRTFLNDGDVPMDNNYAEQAIRPFTIGRKNFVLIETSNGARASAMIYSIVETAKANALVGGRFFSRKIFSFDRLFRFLCGSFGLRGCVLVLICLFGGRPRRFGCSGSLGFSSAFFGASGCFSGLSDFWKNKHPEVLVTGIHEDASQADDIPLLTIDDVTFAILNYTYGANTETLPLDLLGHLNLLCAVNEKNGQMDFTTLNPQVLEDISRAKELADIVIVCPHWGTEYSSKISSYQEKWALEMTEAGADIIIGTHPHVVEPVEWITAENGNESLCYYSLGNYVSTQKNALSMLEGMAWLTFHVAEDGVSIERKTTGVIPLVCQYTSGPVRFENVYLLEEYTEELAASHGIRNYAGVVLHLEDLQKWSDEILGDFVLTKDQALHNFKTDSINQ